MGEFIWWFFSSLEEVGSSFGVVDVVWWFLWIGGILVLWYGILIGRIDIF